MQCILPLTFPSRYIYIYRLLFGGAALAFNLVVILQVCVKKPPSCGAERGSLGGSLLVERRAEISLRDRTGGWQGVGRDEGNCLCFCGPYFHVFDVAPSFNCRRRVSGSLRPGLSHPARLRQVW